ncbi:MAG: hypothetical protein P4L83_01650 [Nevskia sp.]|nr:hypothetical protein [Nevskia sp.]
MTSPDPIRLSLRMLVAWCVLSAAGFIFVRPITSALLPVMESASNGMQSEFIVDLSLEDAPGGPAIRMECTTRHPVALGSGNVVPAYGVFEGGSVDAVHALVPVVIFLVVIAAWPFAGYRELAVRLLGTALPLPVIVALTTSLLLVERVEVFLNHAATYRTESQFVVMTQPFVFMESGGRWLLPLLAAALCVGIGGRLSTRRSSHAIVT